MERSNSPDPGQPGGRTGISPSAYNEMLAGMPVKASDEILAKIEAILRNDGKIPAYTVVAAIRIRRKTSPAAKRRVLLLFPAV
jgi:hypothetical protein